MSVTNYTDLQTEILGYLDRSDTETTNAVPGWIQLTEAKINRTVKVQEQEQLSYIDYDTSFTEPFIAMPSKFIEFYSLKLKAGTEDDYEYRKLLFLDPSEIDREYDNAGEPTHYTIRDQIELNRLPDKTYTVRMHYLKRWDIASDSTNWLLTNFPDVYVYGALVHGMAWIKDVDKEQRAMWSGAFKEAVAELNEVAYRNRPQGELDVSEWDVSRRYNGYDVVRGRYVG